MKYRPDIDGLRALAIAPVVLYHARVPGFSGGFVGVDVFFVISGYLITRIVADEVAAGRFSVTRFYVRRAKRILPALFVVLGSVLVTGLCVLTPDELRGLGRMTAATSVFASNLVLWIESGYFDAAAETKPLLMTWSLGIEEQFYVLWPIVLLTISRRAIPRTTLVGALGLGSFAFACWGAANAPGAAFYLLPGRAWELLLGAALALRPPTDLDPPGASALRDVFSLVGLALLAGSCFWFDKASVFPGWNALPSSLGTVLLIWSGDRAMVNRHLLSRGPLVFFGLVSYSLYLWHWPVLSMVRIVRGSELPSSWTLMALSLAVSLSVLSWRYIEKPFRGGVSLAPMATLGRYGSLSLATFLVGSVVYLADGLPGRVNAGIRAAEAARRDYNPLRDACLKDLSAAEGVLGPKCEVGSPGQPLVALWGDSHADALAPGVRYWAGRNGYGFRQISAYACPPLPGAAVVRGTARFTRCDRFNARTLDTLRADPAIDAVVLAARWTFYTETSRGDLGGSAFLTDGTDRALSSANSQRVLESSLGQVTAALTGAGKRVVLVGQVPEMNRDVPSCYVTRSRLDWLGLDSLSAPSCDAPAPFVGARLEFTNSLFLRIAAADQQAQAVLPSRVFCTAVECRSEIGGSILYSDDDHLSASGARYLVDKFDFRSLDKRSPGVR